MQRVRITLELAERLPLLGKGARAVELLEGLRKDLPEYPDQPALLRPLVKISGQLGKSAEQAKYQAELDRLPAAGSTQATNSAAPLR
jgi:hypothetical protein